MQWRRLRQGRVGETPMCTWTTYHVQDMSQALAPSFVHSQAMAIDHPPSYRGGPLEHMPLVRTWLAIYIARSKAISQP